MAPKGGILRGCSQQKSKTRSVGLAYLPRNGQGWVVDLGRSASIPDRSCLGIGLASLASEEQITGERVGFSFKCRRCDSLGFSEGTWNTSNKFSAGYSQVLSGRLGGVFHHLRHKHHEFCTRPGPSVRNTPLCSAFKHIYIYIYMSTTKK